MSSFTKRWSTICLAMDANDFGMLPVPIGPLLQLISKCALVAIKPSNVPTGHRSGSSAGTPYSPQSVIHLFWLRYPAGALM